MKSKIVLDTNYLMNEELAIENLLDQYDIILSITTVEELDNLKTNDNYERAYKARHAIKQIENNLDKIHIDTDKTITKELIEDINIKYKNDNLILSCAKKNNALIGTLDLNMRIKAKGIGLEIANLEKNEEEYKGYKIIRMTDEELAQWYENEFKVNSFDLLNNQYLLIESADGEIVDKLKWTDKGYVRLKTPSIKGLKPLNHIQACAFDLMASETPIKLLLGRAGSGKTLINIKSALHFVEKGKYQRILYLRNPIGKGEQIGFLPGSKLEKMESFLAGVVDNLDNGEDQLRYLISQEKLIVECPYFLKGASKEATWFLVDEAEDLDIETLKLIGTRLAKESVICLSGDLHQTEKKYKGNNGLKEFIDKFKGNPLVGIVKLNEDVRSEVSRLFNEL